MKVAFVSNFLNHHQVPVANVLYDMLGEDYAFIATTPVDSERLLLGYEDLNQRYPYVVRAYRDEAEYKKALHMALTSDVMVAGYDIGDAVRARMRQDKLTFRCSERFFKNGRWRLMDPRVFRARYIQDIRYRKKNLHMLCASAYTAPDCHFIHAYPDRMYKWGYFTEVRSHDWDDLNKPVDHIRILWASRFIPYKHPEYPVGVMRRLCDKGYRVSLDMIGIGERMARIRAAVAAYGLQEKVRFLGAMPPEAVVKNMEESNVFLVTPDRREGWGAVVGEAMASGCAVVACSAAGSVPFLIHDGVNGFAYDAGDLDGLYRKVEALVCDRGLREKTGREALATMQHLWHPKVAGTRFIELCHGLLKGEPVTFHEGPCSVASVKWPK